MGDAGGASGGGADGDDSSDWEEVSEDGEGDEGEEALSVPGLLGHDLLDITAAQAAANDDVGNLLRVSSHPSRISFVLLV